MRYICPRSLGLGKENRNNYEFDISKPKAYVSEKVSIKLMSRRAKYPTYSTFYIDCQIIHHSQYFDLPFFEFRALPMFEIKGKLHSTDEELNRFGNVLPGGLNRKCPADKRFVRRLSSALGAKHEKYIYSLWN